MMRPFCVLCFLILPVGLYASPPSPQASVASPDPASAVATTTIPGPLRSFLRMSAISQKVSRDEVFPLLARNVSVQGYQDGKPTEFLVLIRRYLDQARELQVLAGSDAAIRVKNCNDAKPLLAVLGYRMRDTCGPKAAVETSDPDRAFLTIDSGFPLAELEELCALANPSTIPIPPRKYRLSFPRTTGAPATRKLRRTKSCVRTLSMRCCVTRRKRASTGLCRASTRTR